MSPREQYTWLGTFTTLPPHHSPSGLGLVANLRGLMSEKNLRATFLQRSTPPPTIPPPHLHPTRASPSLGPGLLKGAYLFGFGV